MKQKEIIGKLPFCVKIRLKFRVSSKGLLELEWCPGSLKLFVCPRRT
jgi:hypothetical protein